MGENKEMKSDRGVEREKEPNYLGNMLEEAWVTKAGTQSSVLAGTCFIKQVQPGFGAI